jgi:hypothetical protein
MVLGRVSVPLFPGRFELFFSIVVMPVQKVKGCREQEECICLQAFVFYSLFLTAQKNNVY